MTEQRLGKYTIQEELGHGSFAVVYRARDTVLQRDVALKILHPVLHLHSPLLYAILPSRARARSFQEIEEGLWPRNCT